MVKFEELHADVLLQHKGVLTYKSLDKNGDILEYWERKTVNDEWENTTEHHQKIQQLERKIEQLKKSVENEQNSVKN